MNLNHVAISVDMDDDARAAILDFYGDVFGWTEGDNTGEEGNPLILYTGAFGQFVYLLPSPTPLACPRLDHFGVMLDTVAELHEIVERAQRHATNDERVHIIDVHDRITHGPANDYRMTSAYIGFLLPMMIELQHLERLPRD